MSEKRARERKRVRAESLSARTAQRRERRGCGEAGQILLNPHNCDNGALFVISGATL